MLEELGIRMEEKVTIKVANDQKSISYVDYNRDWIGELGQSNGHYYCCVDIAQYLWMNETYQLAPVKRLVEVFKETFPFQHLERGVKLTS